MISSGAAGEQLAFVYFMLVAASAGVFLHAGIKFPWFVFFQKDSGLRPADPPWNMRVAMILFAAACIVLGVFPNLLYALLPYEVNYVPYTADHVVTQFQLLLFAGLAFFVMLPWMKRTETVSLDFDWFWRIGFPKLFRLGERALDALRRGFEETVLMAGRRVFDSVHKHHGASGLLARTWPIGAMVLWVAVMLVLFILIDRI